MRGPGAVSVGCTTRASLTSTGRTVRAAGVRVGPPHSRAQLACVARLGSRTLRCNNHVDAAASALGAVDEEDTGYVAPEP